MGAKAKAQAFDKFLPKDLTDPLVSLPGRNATTGSTPTSLSSISLPSSSSSSSSISANSTSSVSSTAISSTSSTSSTSSSVHRASFSPTPLPVIHTTVTANSSSSAAPAADNGSNTSFLQNKAAAGIVFTLVGVVALVVVMFVATFFLRRKRNKKFIEDAVSFDPVTVGHDELEKAKQGSSLGHGSPDAKTPSYGYYPSPPLHYGSPMTGYPPYTAAPFYGPPVRYGSPPPPPQYQQQHHLSYISAMSSADDAHYPSGDMRALVGPMGGQVPEDIRRQYSSHRTI